MHAAEMSWKAGIDVLSFGATKNGALACEAVIFFDPLKAAACPFSANAAGIPYRKDDFSAHKWPPTLRMAIGSIWR